MKNGISWNWIHSGLVRIFEEELEWKVAARSRKWRLTVARTRHADHTTPLYQQKLALKFADQRQSLGRYTSPAN
jgi:hypothetical protein